MTLRHLLTIAAMEALLLSILAWGGCNGGGEGWSWTGGGSQTNLGTSARRGSGEWVIVLAEYRAWNRRESAEALRRYLLSKSWRGVGVLHDADAQISSVIYGPFKYGTEMKGQLKQVLEYKDPQTGVRPFRGAYMKELPRPAPPAPPEWSLVNAPGYWSLQIAHYVEPGPAFPVTRLMKLPKDWDRMQAAVDACRLLRERGIEAYYYHGEKISHVTVGAFPKEAFQYIPHPRHPRYEKYDPVKDEYLDWRVKQYRDRVAKNAEGKDEKIFRYNLQNGLKVIKVFRLADGRVLRRPWPSFLVKIPKPEDDLFGM